MLNRAARYFPLLRELKQYLASGDTVLEVGSGSLGMGEFSSHPFVGCDVSFTSRPKKPMIPVMCSGRRLPFRDGAFDAVVVSDVIEHVALDQRQGVIAEALRVAGKVAVFGYPCGPGALALDRKLRTDYQARKMSPPVWLEEHLRHPFPDEHLFQPLPDGWNKRVFPNERLEFHYWMMRKEMRREWDYSFRLALLLMPGITGWLLRHADGEPSYRKIFVLTRQ